MRWLLIFLLLIGVGLFGGYVFVKGYPYRLYSHWVSGKDWNKYYVISGYKSMWLGPIPVNEVPPYKEDYAQLWKDFPLRNAMVPLPIHHPMFQTIPFLESTGPKNPPQLGIIIQNPTGREISRIYTLPTTIMPDFSQGQNLFKLPFVRNRILKLPQDKLWKNIFDFKIVETSKSLDAMIYDLYILFLRSKVLPKAATKYSLLSDDKAIMELSSQDKDYMMELIMTNNNGSIYSYVIRTEIRNDESQKLRSKFLQHISFRGVESVMTKFLYTEFKQLNYARQVDQEGMLYLFSAWSQDVSNVDMLKEMIFYLERGRTSKNQLGPLYAYALKHFGKTFTTKNIFDQNDDPNIVLQRKIEIEKLDKTREASREKEKPPVEAELTPDEKMNLYLKKAKESGPSDQTDMTIH